MALLGSGGRGRGRFLAAAPPAAHLGLGLLLAGSLGAGLRGQTAGEYQVKAAFLFNFAKFVEWPRPDPAGEAINLCVVGDDPFGGVLDQMVKGKLVNGRSVEVQRIAAAGKIESCDMAFLGASERKRIPAILEGLGRAGVLTVGETEDFTRQGGVIGFFLDGNHVRFEVNLDAAERARLKISSKLLNLAKIVRNPPAGGRS
ncbi:MAG TPA: YfiR family protein [Terriglobia bacterium]|nr:YfiR family protein [Terriglobia bacterium]